MCDKNSFFLAVKGILKKIKTLLLSYFFSEKINIIQDTYICKKCEI